MVKYVLGLVEAADISADDFKSLLARYPSTIEEVSESKGAKDGQKTLLELDNYRFGEALRTFGSKKPDRPMELDDVKKLVEWKLRHGKFRPSLMKLVSSNDPSFVKETIQGALKTYRAKSDAQAALNILTKLKGIGPATASLLLTVHDPENVIFFSDEAYWWVACAGKRDPIKYNAKEYQTLQSTAKKMASRLGVSATDIEKVSWVLMRPTEPLDFEKLFPGRGEEMKAKVAAITQKPKATASSTKRKAEPKAKVTEEKASQDPPLRRSKRIRS